MTTWSLLFQACAVLEETIKALESARVICTPIGGLPAKRLLVGVSGCDVCMAVFSS